MSTAKPLRRSAHEALSRRSVAALLAAIVAAAVGGPALAAVVSGGIDVPHNDDWAYSRIALDFARTGHIHLLNWNEMSLVGHVLWAWPFLKILGAGQAQLNVSGIAAATLGLGFTYLAARALLDRPRSLLVTASVAAAAGYSELAATYMTDVSAFASQVAALALGLRAVDPRRDMGRRLVLFAAALGVGVYSFTIRQLGMAVVASVAVVFLAQARGRSRSELVAAVELVLAGLAAIGLFYAWRQGLAGSRGARTVNSPGAATRLGLAVRAYFTVSFALIPVLLVAALRRPTLGRRSAWAAAAVVAAAAASLPKVWGSPSGLFLGDYFTRYGPNFQGPDAPVLFPTPLWAALSVLAVAAGAAVAALAASVRFQLRAQLAAPGAVLILFGLLQTALILWRAEAIGLAYDRYLWPLVLVSAVLLLLATEGRHAPARAWAAAAAAAAVAIGVGVVSAVEDQTSGAARWRAGELAATLGYSPQEVDAGFEWVGIHYRGRINLGDRPKSTPPLRWYLASAFPDTRNCIVVSHIPPTDISLPRVGSVRYRSPSGRHELWLYRNPGSCGAG